jgi:hypothetical protein
VAHEQILACHRRNKDVDLTIKSEGGSEEVAVEEVLHAVAEDDVESVSVFWTGNLLRGVPEVDECDSPRSVTRRKRHAAHNLDRFGPRGA